MHFSRPIFGFVGRKRMDRPSKYTYAREPLSCSRGERGAAWGWVSILLAAVAYLFVSILPAVVGADLTQVSILAGLLMMALAFEFINGFHDTANAVTTVIYTQSLSAQPAVIWSGIFNFSGVLFSAGGVAFSIAALLPSEPLLELGKSAGFIMVCAVLLAAISWNLATWYFGLPSSSTHALIGSIIGVGGASAMQRNQPIYSGIDWERSEERRVGKEWSSPV